MEIKLPLKWKLLIPGIIVAGIFLVINMILSYVDLKKAYLDNFKSASKSLSNITIKKLEEQISTTEFHPSMLSTATADLQSIADGSDIYTELMLIQPNGKIAAHNISSQIGHKMMEEDIKKIGNLVNSAEVIQIEDIFYTVIPVLHSDSKPRAYFLAGMPQRLIKEKIFSAISMQVLLLGIYIFLITGAAIIYIHRIVIAPISKMIAHTQQVESGDLSHDAKIKTGDEINKFIDAYNSTVRKLKDMIFRVKGLSSDITSISENISSKYEHVKRDVDIQNRLLIDTIKSLEIFVKQAKELSSRSESLNTMANETSLSINNIGAAIQNVDGSMKELAEALNSISSAVEEINSSIREVADHSPVLSKDTENMNSSILLITRGYKEVNRYIEDAAGLAERANSNAEEGKNVTSQTANGINSIRTSMEETHSIIDLLVVRSRQIGDILNVINGIAEQTNLLALNAAIIASQAGEHGKGFHVVAGEIRNLAERTAASTAEIDTLIKSAQNDTQRALESVEKGKLSVENGEGLAKEASVSLSRITDSTQKVLNAINIVGKITKEQANTTINISDTAARISENIFKITKVVSEQVQGTSYITTNLERINSFAKDIYISTSEEVRNSKQVSRVTEEISTVYQKFSQSTNVQLTESSSIFETLKKIQNIMQDSLQSITEMHTIMSSLEKRTNSLDKEMEQFRIN